MQNGVVVIESTDLSHFLTLVKSLSEKIQEENKLCLKVGVKSAPLYLVTLNYVGSELVFTFVYEQDVKRISLALKELDKLNWEFFSQFFGELGISVWVDFDSWRKRFFRENVRNLLYLLGLGIDELEGLKREIEKFEGGGI